MLEAVQRLEYGVLSQLQRWPTGARPMCRSRSFKKDGSGCRPCNLSNLMILAIVARTLQAQAGTLYCVGCAENADWRPMLSVCASRCRCWWAISGRATFGKDDNALLLVAAQPNCRMPASACWRSNWWRRSRRRLPDTLRA